MSQTNVAALEQATAALRESFIVHAGIPESLATPLLSWAEGLLYQRLRGSSANDAAGHEVQPVVSRVLAALDEVQRLALSHKELPRRELSEQTAALFPARALRSPAFTVRVDELVDNGGSLDAGQWLTALLTLLQASASFGSALPRVSQDDAAHKAVSNGEGAAPALSPSAPVFSAVSGARPSEPNWWLVGLLLLVAFMILLFLLR
ncbi:MAG: hypothetical protein KDD73_14745 [Anaerolineales bacterium]|nr:hypothetical protein [Anaerolineales bacterium]MCB9128926.1 hypothetical protein [Ardenticatenales bacterium]